MIASHLAAGSFLDKVSHPSVWVDGASGFVLFSGILIGIVQRSTRRRHGTAAGVRKLGKRMGSSTLATCGSASSHSLSSRSGRAATKCSRRSQTKAA